MRDPDPVFDLVAGVPPQHVLRRAPARLVQPFDSRKLDGLCHCHVPGRPIPDSDLHWGCQRRDRQRDRQRRALVAPPAPAQSRERVRGGEDETGDDISGDVHVDQLVPEVRVLKQRSERVNVDDLPSAQAKPAGMVHPGVDCDHHQRPGEAADHDRDPAQQVGAPRQAPPPIDVDADEDRLHEEGEAFDREPEAEHAGEPAGEVRPQQTHLEAQHRARDGADGEQRNHHARPAPGE